jgi:predicted DNA-binding WGR domain protein
LDIDELAADAHGMSQLSFQLYCQRIDASKNMARYYALSLQPMLFGEASLVRCWGRIGTRGQEKVHVFADEREAIGLFLRIARQKRSRGYKTCGNLPD